MRAATTTLWVKDRHGQGIGGKRATPQIIYRGNKTVVSSLTVSLRAISSPTGTIPMTGQDGLVVVGAAARYVTGLEVSHDTPRGLVYAHCCSFSRTHARTIVLFQALPHSISSCIPHLLLRSCIPHLLLRSGCFRSQAPFPGVSSIRKIFDMMFSKNPY